MVPADYTLELAQRLGYQGRTDRPASLYLYVPLSHLIHVTCPVESACSRPALTGPCVYGLAYVHRLVDRWIRAHAQVCTRVPGGTVAPRLAERERGGDSALPVR